MMGAFLRAIENCKTSGLKGTLRGPWWHTVAMTRGPSPLPPNEEETNPKCDYRVIILNQNSQ